MVPPKLDEATIFNAARQIDSAQGRQLYLERACAGDGALQARLQALLRVHDEDQSFLRGTVPWLPPTPTGQFAEALATQIGPYQLLQQLGEGGFGVVYLAQQDKPVRRRVALKILKAGMDTAQVLARFEAERQALALMEHPHIAKVLDAGTTESGRPYFVMELVPGVPITTFCDNKHLSIEERLKLFQTVCQAIQHAHHKGVIHRDVKPSNVLVTLQDDVPAVKVIDFGIAKATQQKLTEKTLFTALGQMMGTPAYMSPEQAGMIGLDVDTRSDVYSLGVLLYELLTGTTPLDWQRLQGASYTEIQRLIREEDPPRPSLRLASLGETAATVAGNRGTEPRQLTRLLAGDLGWIVMKALEKDRNRRYDTPGSLAEDVGRYRRGEAILARPPSARYRLGKFIQRYRAAVLAGTAIAAALLLGLVVATWQAVVATRAKENAQLAAAAEKKAKETALAKEAQMRAVLTFVRDHIFAAARPLGKEGGLGREVTLRRALEAALPVVEKSFADQPLVEAPLRMTLGSSFMYLGQAKVAAAQFERARALYTEQLGPEHPLTLESMNNLANSYFALDRYAEALELREQTLAVRQATLGPDHPDTLISMNNLANSYFAKGWSEKALKLHEETLARRRATLGPDHDETLWSTYNVAGMYAESGQYAKALELFEEVLQQRISKRGRGHLDTLDCMFNAAHCCLLLGQHAKALERFHETLALRQARLDPDHPEVLRTMDRMADCYDGLDQPAKALPLHEKVLALRKAKLGANHQDTLESMHNLANTYAALQRDADALKLHEEAQALYLTKFEPKHPDTIQSAWALARVRLRKFKKAKDAGGCRAVAEMGEKLQPTDPDNLYSVARYRAVTAAVLRATDPSANAARQANAEADRAMAWLKKAIAAGYKDVANMKTDEDLNALRDRADFQKLLADLQPRS